MGHISSDINDTMDEEEKSGMNDSPLVTPRKEPDDDDPFRRNTNAAKAQPSLMEQLNLAINDPMSLRRQTAPIEEDTKKRGWQERLEKLKLKKAEDKARQKAE